MKDSVLVVAAHPDDEVLGCGATMARYAAEGRAVSVLILGAGVASRGADAASLARSRAKLEIESDKANKILGVRKVYRADFPDNRFDTVALLDVVQAIEAVKAKVKPALVLTHHAHDVNVDHQVAFRACLAAFRPQPGEAARELRSFYVLSSTDWQAPSPAFAPNLHVDVASTLEKKVRALEAYRSEIRPYPHPRSSKGVRIEAQRAGLRVGLTAAEAFEVVRRIER